eukprot:4538714-Pyramimonas_sp.AAC.1
MPPFPGHFWGPLGRLVGRIGGLVGLPRALFDRLGALLGNCCAALEDYLGPLVPAWDIGRKRGKAKTTENPINKL